MTDDKASLCEKYLVEVPTVLVFGYGKVTRRLDECQENRKTAERIRQHVLGILVF